MFGDRLRRDHADVSQVAPTVDRGIAVQDLHVVASYGNSDAIAVPRYGSEVADNNDEVVRIFGSAQEGNDATLPVVAVYPLETARLEIDLEQGRLRPVEAVQVTDQVLQPPVVG